MFKMTAIIKYLTLYVILDFNERLDQNAGQGALYKSDRGRNNSYLKNIGMVYLDKNALTVQDTIN